MPLNINRFIREDKNRFTFALAVQRLKIPNEKELPLPPRHSTECHARAEPDGKIIDTVRLASPVFVPT